MKYLCRGNEIKAYCEGSKYYSEGTKNLFQGNEINDYFISRPISRLFRENAKVLRGNAIRISDIQ